MSSVQYVKHTSEGQILGFGVTESKRFYLYVDNAEVGEQFSIIEPVDYEIKPEEHYVSSGVVVERPTPLTYPDKFEVQADSLDEVTITPLVLGTDIYLDDDYLDTTVNEGDVVNLTFEDEGAYIIRLENFPYKTVEFTINAI